MQAARRAVTAFSALGTVLLGGCTTVVIHSDGVVRTESRFGIVHLDIAPRSTTAVAVSSFGAVSLPGTFALGHTRWQGVGLPPTERDSCVLVTFEAPQPTGAEK